MDGRKDGTFVPNSGLFREEKSRKGREVLMDLIPIGLRVKKSRIMYKRKK